MPPGGGQTDFVVNVTPAPGSEPPYRAITGTAILYDGATAIGSPATLIRSQALFEYTFAQAYGAPDPALIAAANGAVWGDFNQDGGVDLLVYGTGAGIGGQTGLVVQTFQRTIPPQLAGVPPYTPIAAQQLALPLAMQYAQSLAVLDVDGDGHADLLAGNTVAYGNGDGTFGRVAVLPLLATGFSQTYAVDVDGDGKLDIVAVNAPPPVDTPGKVQFAFTVFHNDGGGNFTAMGPYPLAPSFAGGSSAFLNIFGLSFADVNGDGRMDILSQSNVVPAGQAAEPAALNIMLNLGTGFGAPKPIDTSAIPYVGMVSTSFNFGIFTDLNNDKKQDLVFSYQATTGNNGVATLLGNGDGTFAAPVNFSIGDSSTKGSALLPLITEPVVLGGNVDVILGSGVLLLGNGDGTLRAATPLFTSPVTPGSPPPVYALPGTPLRLVPGTIPGGDFTFLNLHPNQNAVFSPIPGIGATLTPLLAPGVHSLTAHYSGDANYAPSVSNTVDVTTVPATPTVGITASAATIYATQPVTFTATVSDPTISGSITFLDVSPNDDNPLDPMAGSTEATLGTGTIANGVATLTTKLGVGGTHTIIAVYGPDIAQPVAQAQLTETVNIPFAINVSSSGVSLAASPGQTVTTTFSIQGLGGFTGEVTLGCGGGAPICSMSPTTIDITGTGTTTVTMTVTASAVTTTAAADKRLQQAALACSLPLFVLLGFASRGRRRLLLLVLGAALYVVPFTGCGGGGSGGGGSGGGGSSGGAPTSSTALKAGSYPFNITATSGQNTQVAQGVLTVQ